MALVEKAEIQINVRRVLLGGLAAGLSVGVCGLGLVPIVGSEMDSVLRGFNLPPLSYGSMAFFGFVSLTLGLAVVLTYAVLQSRMKPGVRTALTAAFFVWLIGCALPNFANVAYGFMPLGLTIIGTFWAMLEVSVGSLVGARIYRGADRH